MTCPNCKKKLTSVIRYFSEQQSIELDDNGEVVETGPVHNDGIEDVACGNCLQSLEGSEIAVIQDLVVRLTQSEN